MKHISIHVWWDRVFLAVVAALISIPVISITHSWSAIIGNLYSVSIGTRLLLLCSSLLFLHFAWAGLYFINAIPKQPFARTSLCLAIGCPPAVISVAVAILALCGLTHLTIIPLNEWLYEISNIDTCILLALFSLFILTFALHLTLLSKRSNRIHSKNNINTIFHNKSPAWVGVEQPIEHPKDDLLKYDKIARRITRSLIK